LSPALSEASTLEIVNVLGQSVAKIGVNAGETSCDLPMGMPSGCYFVRWGQTVTKICTGM
jgi:hypothetical protein